MKILLLPFACALVAGPCLAAPAKPYTRNVAIVVYDNAEPLDWTGPFEVYNDAAQFGSANGQPAFHVYVVSKTKDAVNSQGMTVVPNYSIADAPKPDIVLFPGGPSAKVYDDPAFFAWAKQASEEAEIAQSVCTGAFVLGKAGLLDGLEVTTHHGSIDRLGEMYPKAAVKRGRRFVDNGHVVTTAGISAGIDGSLHVVARLLGRRVADEVATYMEYAWTPEASLATGYSYFNPSTDDLGRLAQTGDMQYGEKKYAEAAATFRRILAQDAANHDAWSSLGWSLKGQAQHLEAAQAFVRGAAGQEGHHAAWDHYNAACQFALAGKKDDAFAELKAAYAAGYPNKSAIAQDQDLASLRDDPRAKELTAAAN
jgi:putative intracellular protease/amidase